jgi:thioredoxin-like negative regulator of GroEL
MEEQTVEAKRLVQAGDTEQALECCRAAVEQAGNDIDAGEARELLDRLEKGETAAAKLLSGLDDIPAAGDLPVEEVDDEAIAAGPEALFDVYLESLPAEQAEAFQGFGSEFRDGYLSLQEGRAKEALEAFNRAPKEVEDHPLFLLEKAQALMQERQAEEALKILDAIDLREELRARRTEMRIVLLQQLGRGDEAVQEARTHYEASRDNQDVAILYGEVLLENGQPQEALDVLEAFRGGQQNPEIETVVARSYVATGKVQEARDLLEGTVEGFFQSAGHMHTRFPVWAARELLYFYIGVSEDPERVRSLVQHLISHDPPSAAGYKEALKRYVEQREKSSG